MADHNRTLKRVLISLPGDDLASLDNLAEAIAEPGLRPNRSAAVRYLIEQQRYRPLPDLTSRNNSRKRA